jgi:hypothetical protein
MNLAIGLKHPINLAMLGVIALAGLLSAWYLVPLGLLLWAGMVINLATSPALQYEAQSDTRAQLRPRFQRIFNRFDRAQREVLTKLEGAPAASRRALEGVQRALAALADEAYIVLTRMSSMEAYFSTRQTREEMRAELRHIDDALPAMTSQQLIEQYKEKRESIQKEMARLQAVNDYIERAETVLVKQADGLDPIMAEIINMTGRSPSEIRTRSKTIIDRLERQYTELEAFEKEEVHF